MDIIVMVDLLSLVVGIIGVVLAIYFYMKSKKREEINNIEYQGRLQNMEVSLTQFRIQERETNYPEIKKEQNIRKALNALVVIILMIILANAISSYLSDRTKRR